MALYYFLLRENLKNWNFSLSFKIYVTYDLKKQACNIYKHHTNNKNLRVSVSKEWNKLQPLVINASKTV